MSRATWSFLALGITIRLVRFFLVHPFWSDESFLAVNLLQRDYLGLLRPLDYQQVSPVLFLWVELTIAKIFGFSEWSLRLFPTLCGIGSLLVFRHLAHRLMRGLPLLFAVAIVSVALNPIRHSGEVKPYASDFLVSTILITMVVEWWRVPERPRWLWILAAFTPFAMALSLPSTFVLGAISLVIAFPLSQYRSRSLQWAYLGFNGMIVVGCLISLCLCSAVSSSETREYMDHYWSSHFPPLSAPAWIPLWLAKALCGQLAAYPIGGANGASTLTVIAVATAAWDLTRRGRGVVVAVCLAPLGMALFAACFRLYPFGESERLMQFEGPMICLLSGYGLAFWLGELQRPRSYRRLVAVCLIVFGSIGVGSIIADLVRPAKSVEDIRAREFARWFWSDVARDSVVACTTVDLGLDFEGGPFHHGRSADYLCLQKVYSPRHRAGTPIDWSKISAGHPLNCVIYDGVPVDSPLFVRWMELMLRHYHLSETETFRVNAGIAPKGHPLEDHLAVLVFTPRAAPFDPVAIAREARESVPKPRRGSLRISLETRDLLPWRR